MIACAPRRIARRRSRLLGESGVRSGDRRRSAEPGCERVSLRPALAALTVVLIGTGFQTVAVADAVHPVGPTPLVRVGSVPMLVDVADHDGSVENGSHDDGRIVPRLEGGSRTDVANGLVVQPSSSGGGAAADEEEVGSTSFRRRPYVAIGAGASRLEPESPSEALTVGEDISPAGEIGIGYDFTRWLSGELHAADLGAAGIDFLGTDVGDLGYRVYGATAVLYLFNPRDGFVPFSSGRDGAHRREGLSLFGRFGVGGLRNDSDGVAYRRDYASHAVFGAGLEYGFRNGVALRAELQAFDTDARYLGVGVLKRFGAAAVPLAAVVPAVLPPAAALPQPKPKPEPAPEPVAVDLPIVHFDFDRSELRSESLVRLDKFVEGVQDDERRIAIDGHTDWIGPERYNVGLSDRRAEAVRDYLVSRGIAAARVTTRGFGETKPVTLNTTDEGRALNRRAEIRLE